MATASKDHKDITTTRLEALLALGFNFAVAVMYFLPNAWLEKRV